MFNVGRILNRRNAAKTPPAWIIVKKPKDKEKNKYRSYVPFVWQALVSSFIGILIVLFGVALCVVGYHSDSLATMSISRSVNESSSVDETTIFMEPEKEEEGFNYLKWMVYIGPAVMSCGGFVMVFSCVVVCELREKAIELMIARDKTGLDPKSKVSVDFYRNVVQVHYPIDQPDDQLETTSEDEYDSASVKRLRPKSSYARSSGELEPLQVDTTVIEDLCWIHSKLSTASPSAECDVSPSSECKINLLSTELFNELHCCTLCIDHGHVNPSSLIEIIDQPLADRRPFQLSAQVDVDPTRNTNILPEFHAYVPLKKHRLSL